jgi:hypothetical protein
VGCGGILCTHEDGKMRPVETIPGRGERSLEENGAGVESK